MSLAVFAALVAAITVVASMTVVAAVGLLFYGSAKGEDQPQGQPFDPSMTPLYDPGDPLIAPTRPSDVRTGPQPLTDSIDARRLVGFFDEEDSSLSRFDPTQGGRQATRKAPTQTEPVYGSPEWTEEEGATEIFSAHDAEESAAAFADFEHDEPTRLTGAGGMVGSRSG